MNLKTPLTNIGLTRDNLRVSFIALVLAILGIVNSVGYGSMFYYMNRATQIIGFIAGIVLLTAGLAYGAWVMARGIIAIQERSTLGTLMFHLLGVFLDFLFLLINIPIVSSMGAYITKAGPAKAHGMALPIVLAVIAILNLAMDLYFLIQAQKKGLEDNTKLSASQLFKPKQPKAQDISMAKAPAYTGTVAFCPNCGSPVVEGAKFCAKCGHELPKGVN